MLRDDLDTPLYMIGIVAQMLAIHPQGNTRLYSGKRTKKVIRVKVEKGR